MSRWVAAGLVCLLLGACTTVHNVSVDVDRLTYANAVGNSREGQALMNLVRIRYGEFPSFVDLTQLVTNYELFGQVIASGLWQPPPGRVDNNGNSKAYFTASAVGTGAIVENPSMVYQTVEGPELVRKLFVPSQISVILALSRSGWAIDRLLATMVTSL